MRRTAFTGTFAHQGTDLTNDSEHFTITLSTKAETLSS